MFGRVAIIGVGLIGSSIAQKLKKEKTAKHIAGCGRTTIKKALDLGIIDSAHTNPAECIKDADIVILCTPLLTYGEITKSISASLKDGAILTDVGSVKQEPTERILANLKHEQQKHFVPGHPIAGTEKSGPEAGFSELFEHKKVILTPLPITDKSSVNTIKKLWEMCGAEVELLDMRRHDFIYASVSHNIQFLSSCFGIAINKLDKNICDEIEKNSDVNFKKFIRLIGSDPIMWRDIYMENIHNLEVTLEGFLNNLETLRENIRFDERDGVSKRFKNAKEKRMLLHPLLKGHDNKNFRRSDYSSLSDNARMWMDIMPRIISCALIEGVAESEYGYASGAGLHGFSKNIILDDATRIDDIFANKDEVIKTIKIFEEAIKSTNEIVKKGEAEKLGKILTESRKIYEKVV